MKHLIYDKRGNNYRKYATSLSMSIGDLVHDNRLLKTYVLVSEIDKNNLKTKYINGEYFNVLQIFLTDDKDICIFLDQFGDYAIIDVKSINQLRIYLIEGRY